MANTKKSKIMNTLTTFEKAVISVETSWDTESHKAITTDKTFEQLTSSEKQNIASEWLKDHCLYNVNQVIESVLQNCESDHYDDALSLAEDRDYETPVVYHIENELDREGLLEIIEDRELKELLTSDKDQDDKVKLILADFEEYDHFETYAEENGIEPDYNQAYEFYLVSDHFERLIGGCSEILGLTVWARFCTGQAICLDYQIQVAAFKALSNCHYDYY